MDIRALKGRSLLTWLDFEADEIRALLDLSKQVKEEARRGERKQRLLGRTVALLFEKSSTRTRCAFETAIAEEGGHGVFISFADTHLGKKETIEDTARVFGRMFSAIEFRGFKQSMAEDLAKYSGIPVFNGLTDDYHPTQALADVQTLEENFPGRKGLKLCFCGDGRNNVARSLMIISAKLGINFTVITPSGLKPDNVLTEKCGKIAKVSGAKIEITDKLDAVEGADAVYTDVWASMGEEAKKEERASLLKPYQVNRVLMDRTGRKDAIFLHCLPAIRGEEVTADVIDGAWSRVWDEAENRKHTIKAIVLASIGDI
ncbi:MAG: ornithine carbamoyltransferase [Spirochaetaceae bacterium]|jgi:ornithine carbamoyltransferase|nr:ornithine carbamoyltransferase [Spirochaetaceae bacterium]